MALSHFQCNDEALVDPYFTPNEWERCFKRARTILSEIRELNETESAKDSIREKCDELPVQCKCRVHTALKIATQIAIISCACAHALEGGAERQVSDMHTHCIKED